MTLDDVFKVCLAMKRGEKQTFVLDEEPDVLVVMNMAYKINLKRNDRSYVMVTHSKLNVTVQCYSSYPCMHKGAV